MNQALDGHFWVAGTSPDTRVRGKLTAAVGQQPEVVLESALVDDPRVTQASGGVAFTASAGEAVASFQPITLLGQLDTGEVVTLVDARNHGGDGAHFGLPRYLCWTAVRGALVNGSDQLYDAVRFRVDSPHWLAHLRNGESSTVEDNQSTLRVEASGAGNWLVYESAAPETLRQLGARVALGCLTLARLVLNSGLVISAIQIRTDPANPWLTVQGPTHYQEPGLIDDQDVLLAPVELTIERFAKWIELHDGLDGLDSAVALPLQGALQAQVMLVTSLVEGLHRRLPYEQNKFPLATFPRATAKALSKILQAARDATGAPADDAGLDRKAVAESILFLTEVSFRTRAKDIAAAVCTAVPEIAESIADLPDLLTAARNDMAHQLKGKSKEPLADRHQRWLIVTIVAPWLLRGLLLLHAGIAAETLRTGYGSHEPFQFARANIAQIVRELGWQLPASTQSGGR